MHTESIQVVVLAAGKSKRFNTGSSKLLAHLCGRKIILYPMDVFNKLALPTIVVVGHEAENIQNAVKNFTTTFIDFCYQEHQNGTAHALAQSKHLWHAENILVINGDMPLVTTQIIEQLIAKHAHNNADITFATAHHADPNSGYGRVMRNEKNIKIVEIKDGADAQECCINAGVYIFKRSFLQTHLPTIANNNAAQEYYITDLINNADQNKYVVQTVDVPFDTVRGINTLKELWVAEQIKRAELISYWMERGVHFSFAQSTHIDINTLIGTGSHIGAGVHIINGTTIGTNCSIESFSMLNNASIGNNVTVHAHSIIEESCVEHNCFVGPFAHISKKSLIKENAVIGNFVEIARSSIGTDNKIKHLAYIGNTITEANVNIGAGTITCNYDGINKNSTHIKENVFIGSNNTLIAPITIEKNAYSAAGSVLTDNVPANALAIGRSRQINKEEYAFKLRSKKQNNIDAALFAGAVHTADDVSQ